MRCLFLVFFISRITLGIEVALTVDDLPGAGDGVPGKTRLEIANQMLEALKAHGLKGVYGFANGEMALGSPDKESVMQAWKAAGQLVGNHTYSHKDFAKTTLDAFTSQQIERNEPFLSDSAS